MKKISLPVSFDDERGKITDLLGNEAINAVTVITFQKGAVRANHYHKNTYQWNYVMSGRIKLVTRMPGEGKVETILGKGDFALTEPEEHHALVGLEYSELLVLTKGPRGGKEYESDTFRIEEPLA